MPNYPLNEVFGIATEVSRLSYVDRGKLDDRFRYLVKTDRHIAVHGDSKQGKSWLRAVAIPGADAILVQCQVETTPESIFMTALSALGVTADLTKTDSHHLAGTLDFTGSGDLGVKILAKLHAEGHASGTVEKTIEQQTLPITFQRSIDRPLPSSSRRWANTGCTRSSLASGPRITCLRTTTATSSVEWKTSTLNGPTTNSKKCSSKDRPH